jgi:PAS domain-containing protein
VKNATGEYKFTFMLKHVSRTGRIRVLLFLMFLGIGIATFAIHIQSSWIVHKGNAKLEALTWMQQGVEGASRGVTSFVYLNEKHGEGTFKDSISNIVSFQGRYQILVNTDVEKMAISELSTLFEEYVGLGRAAILQKKDVMRLIQSQTTEVPNNELSQQNSSNASTTSSTDFLETEKTVVSEGAELLLSDNIASIEDINKVSDEIRLQEDRIDLIVKDFLSEGEKIEVLLRDRLQARVRESIDLYSTYIQFSVYLIGIIMLLGFFAVFRSVQGIHTAILSLKEDAGEMARGDTKKRVEIISGDEIGQLANEVNVLAKKLEDDKEAMHAIVNLMPNPFFILNRREEILATNEKALEATGYASGDILGKNVNSLLQNMKIKTDISDTANVPDGVEKKERGADLSFD